MDEDTRSKRAGPQGFVGSIPTATARFGILRCTAMTNDANIKNAQPPCEHCEGWCCRQTPGHDFAVLLEEGEVYAEAVAIKDPNSWREPKMVNVLPYVDGRCVYLGKDNKCSVYSERPNLCRQFSCTSGWKSRGDHHGFFLEDNPKVVNLIELHVLNSSPERA